MVDTVLQLGDDQLQNQFALVFPGGIPGGGNAELISLRLDGGFDAPAEDIYSYDIDFRGSKVTKTGKKEETDKTLTATIRLDGQWVVWDDLYRWKNLVYDPKTNIALPDLNTRTTIAIQCFDASGNVAKTLTWRQSKIKSLKPPTLDQKTGDPATVEVTFIYGVFEG